MPANSGVAGLGSITEPAPAKLNLTLHVVGRRADGFHLLDGLVAFTALGDRVTVRPAGEGQGPRLRVDGPFASALAGEAADGNLVVRAALGLGAALGRAADVDLILEKHLPVASGIGGGSADAAATLRAMARLWEVPADHPALAQTAAGLGADVPMCLASRTAWISGTGTVDAAGPNLAGVPIVLVNPGVPLSTPAVFRARSAPFSEPDRFEMAADADRCSRADVLAAALAPRRNDLAEAATALAPVIRTVLAHLADAPGCRLARMSGSGATCFGLFAEAQVAEAAATALAQAAPAWWVRTTTLLA